MHSLIIITIDGKSRVIRFIRRGVAYVAYTRSGVMDGMLKENLDLDIYDECSAIEIMRGAAFLVKHGALK